MTDAAMTEVLPAEAARPAGDTLLRPATSADLGLVHAKLREAILTSPHYGDQFKAYESRRLTKAWLGGLFEADPWHVAVMQTNGEPVGFMASGPELGTLWLYWSYVFPDKRRSRVALLAMRSFLAHWDQNRFHKVATYTRPGNDAAIAIMERFGWRLAATLQRHMFGEDYLLYEHMLQKTVPGYDHGARLGRLAQVQRTMKRLIGR
jgi:RimJ/RimL family protein N-acetyltransferase